MRLKKLTLHNFRCYEHVEIVFSTNPTVLVAINGEGKTSILDAVRIALWPFVSQFDLAKSANNDPANGIQIDDVRSVWQENSAHKGAVLNEMARQLPCSISVECDFQQKSFNWTRVRESEARRSQTLDGEGCADIKSYAKSLQKQVRNFDQPTQDLPLFGYYGTGRLWQHKRKTNSKLDKANHKIRTFAYMDCLDPASSFRQFEDWFVGIFKTAREQQLKALEKGEPIALEQTPYYTVIKVIQKAINTVLEPVGWHSLEFSQAYDASLILKNKHQGTFKVSQLSDGIKNVLGMVSDIAYRCVQLNGHLGEHAAERTQGVFLIDEVDMHLHPSWQQIVVSSLQKAFPALQFVLTTHSPQVLTTVPSDSIRILKNGQAYKAPQGSQGAEASRMLNRIFEVESRPPHDPNTHALQKYAELVYSDQWSSQEAKQLRAQLDEAFRGQEPKLLELDLYIENKEWELSLEDDS